MPSKPPVLPYADLPARHGVVIDRSPGQVRIVIPPARWWQRHTVLGTLALLLLCLYAFVMHALQPRRSASNIVVYCLLLVMLLWALVQQILRERPTTVLLTERSLSLHNVSPIFGPTTGGKLPRRTFTFSSQSIYSIHFASASGTLFIRAHGQEMLECRVRSDRALTEWLADFLRQELGLPTTADSAR